MQLGSLARAYTMLVSIVEGDVKQNVTNKLKLGAKDANYNIKSIDLLLPQAGALLEKFTFNLSKIFTAGAIIAL